MTRVHVAFDDQKPVYGLQRKQYQREKYCEIQNKEALGFLDGSDLNEYEQAAKIIVEEINGLIHVCSMLVFVFYWPVNVFFVLYLLSLFSLFF